MSIPLLVSLMAAQPAPLDARITASWENVEVRKILRRLETQQQVSLLKDRRIDPSRKPKLALGLKPVREYLAEIAKQVDADIRFMADTAYIGPRSAAVKVLTLEALRLREMQTIASANGRLADMVRRRSVSWEELDEPRGILTNLAKTYGLTIENPDVVPHDVWPAGSLRNARITEALTLLLIQFDLTFAWTNQGKSVRLVPVPDVVAIQQTYTPRLKGTAAERRAIAAKLLAEWKQEIPGLEGKVLGRSGKISVQATAEQHATIAKLLDPRQAAPRKANGNDPLPINRREFTLRIENVRVRDLMTKLEESGIEFEYDAAALTAAEVNLNQTVKIDVTQADAKKFFTAMFSPLNLKFTIDGLKVTLSPE